MRLPVCVLVALVLTQLPLIGGPGGVVEDGLGAWASLTRTGDLEKVPGSSPSCCGHLGNIPAKERSPSLSYSCSLTLSNKSIFFFLNHKII